MQSKQNQAIHVVIGPTASGKSEYAVGLAKKHNGEIISADSRQVYRGLDIGTGKIPGHWVIPKSDGRHKREYIYKNIRHHCIDFVSPKHQYTVSDFKRDGEKAIRDILSRDKTPIICGGTGQFIDALVLDTHIPEVPPNPKFRKQMEKKTPAQLFALLKKKDPVRASSIDSQNPRRLIRALEIVHATGKPVPEQELHMTYRSYKTYKSYPSYKTYTTYGGQVIPIKIHYLNPPRAVLFKRIEKRLKERINLGMVKEVVTLRAQGITWKRLEELGLEYRYVSRYVRSENDMKSREGKKWKISRFIESPYYVELLSEIKHYAKRQETWFKKYTNVAK